MKVKDILTKTNVWTHVKIRDLKNTNEDIISDLLININSKKDWFIDSLYEQYVCAIQVIDNALILTIIIEG